MHEYSLTILTSLARISDPLTKPYTHIVRLKYEYEQS